MTNKITLSLVLMMVITTAIFSQSVLMANPIYDDNLNEDEFRRTGALLQTVNAAEGFMLTQKLPNSVHNDINNRLRNYSLDVGDVFVWGGQLTNGQYFSVVIRITNSWTGQWQYFAFMKM
jgi:hypothetical protein